MTDSLERRIECDSGKLLYRGCEQGIKVWCEKHRREELQTWEFLDALRQSFHRPDVHATISDHTEVWQHVV